ncbi:MAG: AbrB/MazE/SpoVT family DNA-binding domain-containing protein [bacterium]|nr:AbrB/MazE/SpoVT family DNA-binding domain-containing protein [bacterium]MCM1376110.1 AbrB/MazE/SpoVT family DNA-binding domain-containing protein [Muribaculum sp.]
MSIAYKKITSHGSISIPVAMRRGLGIESHDPMEVEEHEGEIRIRPYIPRCVFCGVTEGVAKLRGKGICVACAAGAYEKTKGGEAVGTGTEENDEQAAH